MSLLTELKRRNVIRVAVAYLVASWLLLQITDVLMSVLGLPEFVGKAVFLLLLIGFIPALIFSWAFELTPEGLRRDSGEAGVDTAPQTARKLDMAVIAMLILVGGLVLYDRVVPESGLPAADEPVIDRTPEAADSESVLAPVTSTDEPDTPALDNPEGVLSLAVLPFTNMSPDPDNEYFADGMSEELLNVLVDVEGLRVPSRTSSFAFKGQNMDIREIARQLSVEHILEGSVRKAGSRVRITAQLIEVSTDTHLWSETYDRDLADIFAIQDEISAHIVEELKLALAIEDSDQLKPDLDAYTLYLHGRELIRQRDPDGLREADQLLEEATRIDPSFADAWAARAMVQVVLPGYVKEEAENYREEALRFANRALELEPDHPEAKLAISQMHNVTGDLSKAINYLEDIVKSHPGHSTARLWLAIALAKSGYLREAFEQITVARSLDPVHPTVLDWYARIAPMADAADEVIPTAERAIRLGRPQGRVPIMQYLFEDGTMEEMAQFVDADKDPLWAWMLELFPVRDDPELLDAALESADQAEQNELGFFANYFRINLYMLTGRVEDFYQLMDVIEPVDDTVGLLVWLPNNHALRQASAMKVWAENTGRVALWRGRGWPDLCRPLGDDDWECD